MAAVRPLFVPIDRDDLERLRLIAHHRGRGMTPSDVAAEALRAWLAGAGQRELADAADALAGPRVRAV